MTEIDPLEHHSPDANPDGPDRLKKTAELTVTIFFDGDYYDLEELIKVSTRWVKNAFDDRDDVATVEIRGIAREGWS